MKLTILKIALILLVISGCNIRKKSSSSYSIYAVDTTKTKEISSASTSNVKASSFELTKGNEEVLSKIIGRTAYITPDGTIVIDSPIITSKKNSSSEGLKIGLEEKQDSSLTKVREEQKGQHVQAEGGKSTDYKWYTDIKLYLYLIAAMIVLFFLYKIFGR